MKNNIINYILIIIFFTLTSCHLSNKDKHLDNGQNLLNTDYANKSTIELGEWSIGNYVNDFDEPTGDKFITLRTSGSFSNSATSGSRLCVKINIEESKYFIIYFDEYCNNINNFKIGSFSSYNIINGKFVNKENRCLYKFGQGYSSGIWDDIEKKKISFIDILKKEMILECDIRTTDKVNYKFTINSKYFNKAIEEAGFKWE